ncbi:NIPSNAP family protein [Phreatobacter oligotrophus]|uniref:NIPSNAP family protein n=1 Tax=Phreatobacter oligotrophus TaxID=1122261 RepID=UPI002355D112|nr:NIPSNAP family protein [Phreatobacter oligotrophus]MBX9989193.1 NIPSNAP family protein [Phreatobacter oligotrophus]
MIVEERDYRIKAGHLAEFVGLYEEHGLPIQQELLGTFHGYFTSETAELNHVVAWWSYESLDDRLVRRDRMMADPRWQAYLAKVKGLVEVQHVRFLRPTRFSPLR